MLVGVPGLRNLTTHINTNINMNINTTTNQTNCPSRSITTLATRFLGLARSWSSSWRETAMVSGGWALDGQEALQLEPEGGEIRAGLSIICLVCTFCIFCKVCIFCRFWRRRNQVRSLRNGHISCLPTLMFMKRPRSYSRFHWYNSRNLSRRVVAVISVLREKPEVNQRR